MMERVFTAKEVSETLGIATSTLRKWSIQLEKDGHTFARDDQEHRNYTEADIVMLRQFKEIVATQSMENASKAVLSRLSALSTTTRTPSVPQEIAPFGPTELMSKMNEILNQLERQEVFNKSVFGKLDELQTTLSEMKAAPQPALPIEEITSLKKNVLDHQIYLETQMSKTVKEVSAMSYSLAEQMQNYNRASIERERQIFDSVQKVLTETRAERHSRKSLLDRIFKR